MTNKRYDGGVLITENLIENVKEELPTFTCAHCAAIVVMNPMRTRERGWCWNCDAYLCDKAGCNAECFNQDKATEYALSGKPGGPFLLRSPEGYTVSRITLPDGSERLVERRQIGP